MLFRSLDKQEHYDLFVPYDDGQAHSRVMGQTNVMNTTNHESGIFYRVRVPNFIFQRLNLSKFVLNPEHPDYYKFHEKKL